jgi:hypothetical protein
MGRTEGYFAGRLPAQQVSLIFQLAADAGDREGKAAPEVLLPGEARADKAEPEQSVPALHHREMEAAVDKVVPEDRGAMVVLGVRGRLAAREASLT